jgi:YHS domain-containing protein
VGDLIEFATRVKERLSASNCVPHWGPGEAERYMAEVSGRRERFEELASRMNEAVIQPRLETLASFFSNACLTKDEPAGRCACWFGYCERFPASTKVAFAVEHDVHYEKMSVRYEVSMTPLFIKLNDRDALTLSLDDALDATVADWVEERLLEFLDSYLCIDRGNAEFREDAATDPVCGMRISRSAAAASESYRGHPYFFCSPECQQIFARKPSAYVEVRTM